MDVFLRCKDLEPEEIRKLAKTFGVRLVGKPAKMQISGLTKDNEASEETLWQVDGRTVKLETTKVDSEERDYVFNPKDKKLFIGRFSTKRAVIKGLTYAIQVITFNLYYDRYDRKNSRKWWFDIRREIILADTKPYKIDDLMIQLHCDSGVINCHNSTDRSVYYAVMDELGNEGLISYRQWGFDGKEYYDAGLWPNRGEWGFLVDC